MPRAKPLMISALAAGSLLLTSGAALAQNAPAPGQAAGLRYLTWAGRKAASPAPATAQPAAAPPETARADLRRPNRVIPRGGFAGAGPARPGLTPAPNATPGGLTPADAWTARREAAPVAAEPAPSPVPYAVPAPARVEPPRELAPAGRPDYLPNRGGQPIPADIVMPSLEPAAPLYGDGAPTAEAPAERTADPMAPRRDAPIFRLQRPAAPPPPAPVAPEPEATPASEATPAATPRRTAMVAANAADRPDRDQGARYYSVHRQNGRTPDPVNLPQPTYIDALAVTMTDTPASQDLAAPAAGPTLIRDAQGRVRAAPAASDGDHQ